MPTMRGDENFNKVLLKWDIKAELGLRPVAQGAVEKF